MKTKPKTTAAEFTPKQRRTVHALHMQAFAVHGIQIFVVGLGVYLAIAEKRGWPAVIIAGVLALYLQAHLPALPAWLEKMRPDDE
ncbi:hypothetical protein AH2_0008 [Burkholderia phage vB_BceS_AH2]|uniref:Uncharacterized protein n=1 Tax=Burkholderia phage vB_BceS_AH2 TaxID=1133022 RepID=I6NTK7_9CAUD|nr:hypothetical protein B613_gp08 [Burkholderia phage vB_BceS_AH2]AEY69519.1 hypothetical protein AH2_0008 [Burkholderia phage vB_BceS_AH2]